MPPANDRGRSLSDQDLAELAAELAREVHSLRAGAAALRTALEAVLEALEPLESSHALQPALAEGIYRAWRAAKEGLAAADRAAERRGEAPGLPPG